MELLTEFSNGHFFEIVVVGALVMILIQMNRIGRLLEGISNKVGKND
jgi:hypothetical protein